MDLTGFVELVDELLVVMDVDGAWSWVNAAWTRVLGCDRAELEATGYRSLLHPDDVEPATAAFAGRGQRGALEGVEHRWRRRDGTYRWLRWTAVRVDEDATVRAVASDVTDARLGTLLAAALEEATGSGTWHHELGTEPVVCSPAVHEVLGTDPDRYQARAADIPLLYGPDAAARLAVGMERLATEGVALDLTLPRHVPDDTIRWVRLTGHRIERGGRPQAIYGTLADVSEAVIARQRLEHLERLIDRADGGLASLSADGTITDANRRFASLVGRSGEQLVGQRLTALVAAQDLPRLETVLTQLADGSIDAGEATVALEQRDGTARYARVNLGSGHGPDGNLAEITVVAIDLDEQTRRGQELVAAQAELYEAQVLAGFGHFQADLVSGRLWWSPALKSLLGVAPDEVPSFAEWLAAIPDQDRASVLDAFEQALRGEQDFAVTHRVVLPSGELRWIEQRGRLRYSPDDGTPLSMRGTASDVTAQRRHEEQLRASEQRLQRVLEAITDGWWDYDARTGETIYSERFLELAGASAEQLGSLEQAWERLVDDPDGRNGAVLAETFARQAQTLTLQHGFRHPRGHQLPVLIRAVIDYDDAGDYVRITGATTDLTEARQASIAKERFVATVSHELRTPLTAIRGALETVLDGRMGTLPHQARALLEVAERNTTRLKRLIDDLLTFERLRSTGEVCHGEPRDLAALIAEVVADQRALLERHGVHAALQLPPQPVEVVADPIRIEQVVLNLLANAARYAVPGSPIRVQVRADAVVAVDNLGPPVPEVFADRLFEPFTQADSGDRRRPGGTGLGLAIAHRIVTDHGGEIGHERIEDTTRFWFRLPMRAHGDPGRADPGSARAAEHP